jgi:hypothetical protein
VLVGFREACNGAYEILERGQPEVSAAPAVLHRRVLALILVRTPYLQSLLKWRIASRVWRFPVGSSRAGCDRRAFPRLLVGGLRFFQFFVLSDRPKGCETMPGGVNGEHHTDVLQVGRPPSRRRHREGRRRGWVGGISGNQLLVMHPRQAHAHAKTSDPE